MVEVILFYNHEGIYPYRYDVGRFMEGFPPSGPSTESHSWKRTALLLRHYSNQYRVTQIIRIVPVLRVVP